MAWRIEFLRAATRDLVSFDRSVISRILTYLHQRVGALGDPRSIGAPLKGSRLGNLWRYRVGDYRIVAEIEDDVVRVLAVRIGHRREVYR